MSNNCIKAVIFDLGNVLIDFDHRISARKISKFTDKTAPEIFDLFFASPITALFEEGKISSRQFFLKIKEMLNLKISYEKFVSIWNEIFFVSKKNLGVYNLARKLKNNYKVMLLSNINILHHEYIKEKFSLLDSFHNIVTSYELGISKPDHLIYQKALEILRVQPGDVFYTDDRQELVESARGLGIKGFVFKGLKQLKDDLLGVGISYPYGDAK